MLATSSQYDLHHDVQETLQSPCTSAGVLAWSSPEPRLSAAGGGCRSRSACSAAVVLGDSGSADRSSEDSGDSRKVLSGDSISEEPGSCAGRPPAPGRGSSAASRIAAARLLLRACEQHMPYQCTRESARMPRAKATLLRSPAALQGGLMLSIQLADQTMLSQPRLHDIETGSPGWRRNASAALLMWCSGGSAPGEPRAAGGTAGGPPSGPLQPSRSPPAGPQAEGSAQRPAPSAAP